MADELGILLSYVDMAGRTVYTSDETRVALLAAMGYEASSEAAAQRELERIDFVERHIVIDPTIVVTAGDRRAGLLKVRLPPGVDRRTADFRLTLNPEGKEPIEDVVPVVSSRGSLLWLRLPVSLDCGYHGIELSITTPSRDYVAVQRRIVHPKTCVTVESVLGLKRGFGIWSNLYTIRSERNTGVGDLTDLEHLAQWGSNCGADFVGINPLHSLRNQGEQISPYCPTSRLYGNELYLDVTAAPEFRACEAAMQMVESAEAGGELLRLRLTSHVDYEAVVKLRLSVLQLLYGSLKQGDGSRQSQRQREFSAYKQREGKSLVDYATFRALEERQREIGATANWVEWPEKYRYPDSPSVAEFRMANERNVDFHCYVQFELDRQLGAAASRARSGMAVGLYGDLALGSEPGGADTWAFQDVFVGGARVGAPPDDFAADGQDWGLPPVSPGALQATGYEFWTKLLGANLRHAGALRIDHVMGLFRQFWIPSGMPASGGAYVKFPARDLLGIVALESTRNHALIVGEDLGTVPSGFQSLLARWGILSSRVLYFERGRDGSFRHHSEYSKRAMVTANTHDLVPLAGYWEGRDLELRREVGGYADTDAYTDARQRRHNEQVRLGERLNVSAGEVRDQAEQTTAARTRAAYLFLAKTPAPLVGVSLDDLAGETEPVNLPGISNARFPSWSRKMGKSVGAIVNDANAADVLRCVAAARSAR